MIGKAALAAEAAVDQYANADAGQRGSNADGDGFDHWYAAALWLRQKSLLSPWRSNAAPLTRTTPARSASKCPLLGTTLPCDIVGR
jgi:hypothetical protein